MEARADTAAVPDPSAHPHDTRPSHWGSCPMHGTSAHPRLAWNTLRPFRQRGEDSRTIFPCPLKAWKGDDWTQPALSGHQPNQRASFEPTPEIRVSWHTKSGRGFSEKLGPEIRVCYWGTLDSCGPLSSSWRRSRAGGGCMMELLLRATSPSLPWMFGFCSSASK